MRARESDHPIIRECEPTFYVDHDDAIVMIGSSVTIRAACLDASMALCARPVQAPRENASSSIAMVRPLVIVVDGWVGLSSEELTDIAVSVGAQIVVAGADEEAAALAARVKLAVRAARLLRDTASV